MHKHTRVNYDETVMFDPDADETPTVSADYVRSSGGHVHRDKNGMLHTCYHSCRNTLLSMSFWLGVTLSYPLEHYLWENVPPFSTLAHYFGLLH